MFDADRPITTKDHDRLNRTVFAEYLARCILDHKRPDSLSIGLYGGPGSGKTSIIHLLVEELLSASANMLEDERPIILNFSPWSYSGQNRLIYHFFRRLSSAMQYFPYLENADKIIYLLELYVSYFTQQSLPKQMQKGKLKKLFTKEKLIGWESGRDLTHVKIELNNVLASQKHKFIIIIDNIERLEDKEIKQIFQITKSMGDYANTVYILAFNKELVIRSLDRTYGGGGKEFLEKVVQLPFEIPLITKQDLENILFDRLQKIVQMIPEDAWPNEYWADVYYAMIKHFFHTCRDIAHYVNTLHFSFAHVKDVVNPVDFFAITALQVFEPAVYAGIRENKDLFTDLMTHVYTDLDRVTTDKKRCDEILNRVQKIPRELLQESLFHLFPRLRLLYQPHLSFYHSESLARKNLRICSPDTFDVYFRLSMSSGYIPEPEMNAILDLAADKFSFSEALKRLNHDNKIIKFLDHLDNAISAARIPEPYIGHVINALMDSADLFPEGETTPLSFNTPMRIHRIFHHLLRRFPAAEKRFQLFHDAIDEATKSIAIIVHELTEQSREHSETEDTYLPLEHRDLSEEHLFALKKLAVKKIEYWADIARLGEHPKLLEILFAWKNWGDEEKCKAFVANLVQSDRGILAFLEAALKDPIDQAITQLQKNPSWETALENVTAFIAPKALEEHAKALFEDLYFEKLREREQLALLIFLDLIKAKTKKVIPITTAI